MSVKIESGVTDGNRIAIHDNRLRELEVQQSLTNYVSAAQLKGRTGVFTLRNNSSGTFGIGGTNIINICNADIQNLLVIDSLFIQIVSSSLTLPRNNYEADLVVTNNETLSSQIFPINDNSTTTKIPLIFSSTPGTGLSSTLIKIFPTVGDYIDMIPQKSDSLILSFGNGIRVSIGGFGGTFTIESFIRFMMVPPEEMG